MLDVAKLATLRAVIEHRSFSAAGQALGLTQPAVSRQVSLLERRLGTQLVRRTQRGVHPTEAGSVLAAHAEAVLDRLALAEGQGAGGAGGPPGPGGVPAPPGEAVPDRPALAEAQVADVAGLRAGSVRLGSFFTALVYLS